MNKVGIFDWIAHKMIPWAWYSLNQSQEEKMKGWFIELHQQDKYDIVFKDGGMMKQTIHNNKRANGTEPYNRATLNTIIL